MNKLQIKWYTLRHLHRKWKRCQREKRKYKNYISDRIISSIDVDSDDFLIESDMLVENMESYGLLKKFEKTKTANGHRFKFR